MKLFKMFKAWRDRRYWREHQLEFLRIMVSVDERWLASEPIAKTVIERYKKAIDVNWYKNNHDDIASFRSRIMYETRNLKK